jgi:hypothetical protein
MELTVDGLLKASEISAHSNASPCKNNELQAADEALNLELPEE